MVSCPPIKAGRSTTPDTRTTNTELIALELSDSDGEVDEDFFVEDDMGVADARERSGSRGINDQIMHWEHLSSNHAKIKDERGAMCQRLSRSQR